jgi:RNA polymerase sigma-70 factor (ECF subfamily)
VSSTAATGLDQAALEALYVRLENPLYNVVYRWLWDPQESRDVVQETFVRLWRMRHRVQLATVDPLTFRIAVNLASNRRRSRNLWRWVPFAHERHGGSASTDPAAALELSERQRRLRQAVDALPDRLRAVVMLCELSELTYDQVAEALAIPPGTVASRRHQAIARLRQTLGKDHS